MGDLIGRVTGPTAAPDELRPVIPSSGTSPSSPPVGAGQDGPDGGAVHGLDRRDVPRWMRGTGKGWVTAEYSMLPGSSPERIDREAPEGTPVGPHPGDPAPHRPVAAGRSDLSALGEQQVIVDCDVLQADGGTRTA